MLLLCRMGYEPVNSRRRDNPVVDLVRAEITEIRDPSGRGRVKISAPLVFGQDLHWAEVLRPGGGKAAYKRGDVVMVAFEGGDPNRPIVMGAVGKAPQP